MNGLNEEQRRWCGEHRQETIALLKELGRIPAPSNHEEQRAAFVCDWLKKQGAADVRIDEALNVVLSLGPAENGPVTAVMAHTDIVFPDTEPLPMREENGRLYAPGIGDDTANLAALLMAAKYVISRGLRSERGLLVVANSGEEGLGNLKGSRHIMQAYAGRITELISLDGNMNRVVNDAVGSRRVRITIRAQGGHSYGSFGNTSAIAQMAELITALYAKQVPRRAKTTYNVGVIEGGTTVNSICETCSILYEYRSANADCLAEMRAFLDDTLAAFRARGFAITVEELGNRPCTCGVDPVRQKMLTERVMAIQAACSGLEVTAGEGSTDANSALGLGIPAVTGGAAMGAGSHTRGEWIDLSAIEAGTKIALSILLDFIQPCELKENKV